MNVRRTAFLISCLFAGWALVSASQAHAGLFSKKTKPNTPATPPLPPMPPAFTNPPPAADTPPPPLPKPVIVWGDTVREADPRPGEQTASTFFTLTNVSTVDAVITAVRPSCGCTTAKLPPMPWTLAPGKDGRMDFSVNVVGKNGTLYKSVSVESTAGNFTLQIKVVIPDPAIMRESNLQTALADRQAVLKNDCAACHVTPAVGKMGGDLFKSACSICHESANRASMVPDLHNLPHPTDRDFWKTWVTFGKPGSLMPAFAKAQDGILTDDQIDSLADYLTIAIPSRFDNTPVGSSPMAH